MTARQDRTATFPAPSPSGDGSFPTQDRNVTSKTPSQFCYATTARQEHISTFPAPSQFGYATTVRKDQNTPFQFYLKLFMLRLPEKTLIRLFLLLLNLAMAVFLHKIKMRIFRNLKLLLHLMMPQ